MKISVCMTQDYKKRLMEKLKYTKVLAALVPLNYFINSGNSVHAFSQTGSIRDSLIQNSQAMQFDWNVIPNNLVYKILHAALEQTYTLTSPIDQAINQYMSNYSTITNVTAQEAIQTFLINHYDSAYRVADILDKIILNIQQNGIW